MTITRDDRLFFYLSAFVVFLSGVCLLINELSHHYLVVFYFDILLKNGWFLACIPLYGLGLYLAKKHSSFSLFFKTLGMVFFVAFVMLLADSGVLTTPFSLHDRFFDHLDHLLQFNLASFLHAVHRKPFLAKSLETVYLSLFTALKIIPLLLASLNETKQVYKYIISFLISCVLGFTIYYFWPSTDPSSVIHGFPFLEAQRHLVTQFIAIHAHRSSSFYEAGLIGFPSFHAIWAILLAYACWPRKALFYPVALFSAVVIVATLASGWHFLVDIIGGGFVAGLSISITNKWVSWAERSDAQQKPAKSVGLR